MTATLTEARHNLSSLWDKATQDREVILLRRRGFEDVALIAATELDSLLETAHLLRSPANAERLFAALKRAKKRTTEPQSVADLRVEIGLADTTSEL